jgi:hypothetical protein
LKSDRPFSNPRDRPSFSASYPKCDRPYQKIQQTETFAIVYYPNLFFGRINSMNNLNLKKLSLIVAGSVVFALANISAVRAATLTFSINPRATFLRTNQDPEALNSVPIDLKSLGIRSGDFIKLERVGDYSPGAAYSVRNYPEWDYATDMIGVFSSSNVILPFSLQNRVRDGIKAGEGVVTSLTPKGKLPTDIPEDFWLDNLTMQVPSYATYLFVGTSDPYPGDNIDPDGDYGVKITTVPEPTTVLGSLAFGIFVARNLKKRK